LEGGIIIGTVDGANIEIAEEVGAENIFLFGALSNEIEDIRHAQRFHKITQDKDLTKVVSTIRSGRFGDASIFEPLLSTLTLDVYCVSKDFGECMFDKCNIYRHQDEQACGYGLSGQEGLGKEIDLCCRDDGQVHL
jgi:glucan phosphorylase